MTTTTTESPFVHCYLLDRKGRGAAIDAAAVRSWTADQGILWAHLETGNAHAIRWLAEDSGLEPLIAEAMSASETRPRSITTDKGLLLIVRGVNTNPGADPEDMVSVRVWIEPDRIISVRRRRLLSVQDVRHHLEQGDGPRTSGEFLIMLLERIAFRIGDVVGRIDEAMDAIEDETAAGEIPQLLIRTTALRRQTAAIRRYLSPQRDALARIRDKTALLTAAEIYDIEEQSDITTRYLEDLELLREQAMLIQEQITTRMSNEQSQRLYVLSIVAAIFLPLSFITGLLGMNVAGLPGLDYGPAFWIAVSFMAAIAAGLLGYFRFKRWI